MTSFSKMPAEKMMKVIRSAELELQDIRDEVASEVEERLLKYEKLDRLKIRVTANSGNIECSIGCNDVKDIIEVICDHGMRVRVVSRTDRIDDKDLHNLAFSVIGGK